ncbi:hypothetical protein [Desulfobulbus sp.]|uniref:hypothetical protein n=1 Tax=Desulfobulbus sp. TaxID=895 RepID=UPI0027B87DCA|nr:hypothetical protein [Desulfobulbus sp.]
MGADQQRRAVAAQPLIKAVLQVFKVFLLVEPGAALGNANHHVPVQADDLAAGNVKCLPSGFYACPQSWRRREVMPLLFHQ